jgi:hypothetical protein
VALLKAWRSLLALLSCVSLGACADTQALGHAEGAVRSCARADACASAFPESFGVEAYFDAKVSRYAPHGFYAYFELAREDGQRGVLELDVPIDSGSERVAADQVSYRELDGDRVSFESKQVEGQLQLPRSLTQEDAYACACSDGLFNLRFVAPGADGLLGTADDLARELDYGHLTRAGEPCAEQLAKTDETALRVQIRECAPPPIAAAPALRTPEPARTTRSPSSTTCRYSDCYDDDSSYTTVDSGCGGSTYNESGCGGTSDDQSEGCASNDSSSSNSGGCGDSSSHDEHDSKSGCEGDTSK